MAKKEKKKRKTAEGGRHLPPGKRNRGKSRGGRKFKNFCDIEQVITFNCGTQAVPRNRHREIWGISVFVLGEQW